MIPLHFYNRSGCSLCEAVWAELAEQQARLGFQVELRDVDSDPAWQAAYGSQVPVITGAGGEVICHYFLDSEALAAYLQRLSSPHDL